jgi:ABC-2 type transport system ATP-binding protein
LVFSASTEGEDITILDVGEHELEFSIQNVLAFGDYHIDVVFDNGKERELIKPAAYQFHMRGFASAAMPVTVPHITAEIKR